MRPEIVHLYQAHHLRAPRGARAACTERSHIEKQGTVLPDRWYSQVCGGGGITAPAFHLTVDDGKTLCKVLCMNGQLPFTYVV